MFRILGSRVRIQRGQAMIEFTLIAPLVLLFLFFIFDFGLALDRRIVLQHAVREAAREAAVKADPAPGIQAAIDQSQGLLASPSQPNKGTIAICYEDQDGDGAPTALEPIKVSASYDYHFSVPFGSLMNVFGASFDPVLTLDPDATAALENEPSDPTAFAKC